MLHAFFFANKKGPGTSFQVAVFVKIFDEIISFLIWQKLIQKLKKLFSILYFLFNAKAFDDAMKFEDVEF